MNWIRLTALIVLVATATRAAMQAAETATPESSYAVATDAIDPFWDDTQSIFEADNSTVFPSSALLGGNFSAIDFGPIIDDLPPFYLQSEALFLHRNNRTLDQPLTNQLFNRITTHDLAFPAWMAGTKILAGYCFSNGLSFEAQYFGMQDWNASANPVLYPTAEPVQIIYHSRLQNFEANLVEPLGRVGLLAGFRYLSWNESLGSSAEGTFATQGLFGNYDRIITHNSLFGLQVGARMRTYWRQFAFDFTPKVGLFDNLSKRYVLSDGAVLTDPWPSASNLAFIGDLAFSATYQMSEHVALRGGYNLIFVDGLALAPDQLYFNLNSTSVTATHNHGGSVLLQGVSAGLEVRW